MNRRTIATLLALAIALVGIVAAGCGGLPDSAVAKVGEVLIPDADYTSQLESVASQYGLSQATDPENYKALASNVLESLVAAELSVQKAASLGVTVTDAEIQAQIDSIINDYYSGDESALVTDLASESLTMTDLEKQVGDYIVYGLVRDEVTKGVAAPSEEQITAYYNENKASYLTEQTVEARHILISVAGTTVRSAATTTTSTVSPDSTETTETTASTTTTTLSELAWAKALATAAQVRADLLAGGSWLRLAASYSDDEDTKSKGGALGTVSQGALIDTLGQEVDNEIFSLELNQISQPLITASGYEIIQVTKINEPRQKTIEEARADITAVLLTQAQEAAWQQFIEQAKLEIKVVYRSDVRPAVTTTLAPTTTTSQATATTLKP